MQAVASKADSKQVIGKLAELYLDAFSHDGFAEIKVEIRILRRGQKEVILHCGKQYRYVVDFPASRDGVASMAEEAPQGSAV